MKSSGLNDLYLAFIFIWRMASPMKLDIFYLASKAKIELDIQPQKVIYIAHRSNNKIKFYNCIFVEIK